MSGSPDLRFSDQANADLREIGFWLRLDSESVGKKFVVAVRATADDLAAFPFGGTEVRFGDADIRSCRWASVRGFRNYLLIYRIVPNGIEVVRLIHGSRDLDALRADP
jgi:toxin ParE1/3/4